MQLRFLGTCSGTEPLPNGHHTSIVLETDEKVYWFDAGESCSYTAQLSGVSLPDTEAIFITHTHLDHTGGLPNLLWTISKLTRRSEEVKKKLTGKNIDVFIPDLDVWEGIRAYLKGTEGGFQTCFSLSAHKYKEGVFYEKNGLIVKALANGHMGNKEELKSFSYRVEIKGKTIVFSGDVVSVEELEPIADNCDILLMETGHHLVEDVCEQIKKWGKKIAKVIFTHHGRAILKDSEAELKKAKDILGEQVIIAQDGLIIEL